MRTIATLVILALAGSASAATPRTDALAVEQVVSLSHIENGGDVLVGKDDKTIFQAQYRHGAHDRPNLWRWASVTKQVIATLVMQEVAAGRIDLDKPVATYLPKFASPNSKLITVRQLLRHQSGLPNPDDTAPAPDAVPAYDAPGYSGSRNPLTGYCARPVKARPGGELVL